MRISLVGLGLVLSMTSIIYGMPSVPMAPQALPLPVKLSTRLGATEHSAPAGVAALIRKDMPGEPLSPTDFENGIKNNLPQFVSSAQNVDPIELAALFEGDIIVNTNVPHLNQRTGSIARIDNNKRWTNGVVPYVISGSYNKQERATIAIGMKAFHDNTCIRFVPQTTEEDYIHILKGYGCSSSVGRIELGGQMVSLGTGCIFPGIVMHELMHAVGFVHEQSREDREGYITINWPNIQNGMDVNFEMIKWGTIKDLGLDYDLDSIMHYGPYAFAKDRSKPTIIPNKTGFEMGQRRVLSKTDIKRLNIFYECSGVDNSIGGNSIVTPEPVNPPQPNSCSDNNQYCIKWEAMGECEKNSAWMNVNCKKSCNQCGMPCKDQNSHCEYWKDNGECTKNTEYMMLYCKKSCGACHSKDDHTAVCDNQNQHCDTWAKMSQCRSNPKYMLSYCKKACAQC